MAVSFGGSDYLYVSDSGITDETILLAAWGYVNSDNAVRNTILGIINGSGADGGWIIDAAMGTANNPTDARKYNDSAGTGGSAINTTPTASWFHIAGFFESNTSRYVYRDGTIGTQNTTSVVDPTSTVISIGAMANSTAKNFLTGKVAEVAIWTGITKAEADIIAAELAKKYPPIMCSRPDLIYEYWPLRNASDLRGQMRGLTLSASGSPASYPHPPMFGRSARVYSFPSGGASPLGVTVNPDAVTYAEQTIGIGLGLGVTVNPDAITYAEQSIGVGLGLGITVNPDAITYAEQAIGLDFGGVLNITVSPDALTYQEQTIGIGLGLGVEVAPDTITYTEQHIGISYASETAEAEPARGGWWLPPSRKKKRKEVDWRQESSASRRRLIESLVLGEDSLPVEAAEIVAKEIRPVVPGRKVSTEAVLAISPAVLNRITRILQEIEDDEAAAEMLLL